MRNILAFIWLVLKNVCLYFLTIRIIVSPCMMIFDRLLKYTFSLSVLYRENRKGVDVSRIWYIIFPSWFTTLIILTAEIVLLLLNLTLAISIPYLIFVPGFL